MNFVRPRYSLVLEPTDTWMIWDNWHELPASIDSEPLIGLSRMRAETVMQMMVRITNCQLQDPAPPRRSTD